MHRQFWLELCRLFYIENSAEKNSTCFTPFNKTLLKDVNDFQKLGSFFAKKNV